MSGQGGRTDRVFSVAAASPASDTAAAGSGGGGSTAQESPQEIRLLPGVSPLVLIQTRSGSCMSQ